MEHTTTNAGGGTLDDLVRAAAIVDHAVIKCLLGGVPITEDNIVLLVGEFADPTDPANAALIEHILRLIEDLVRTASNAGASLGRH